MAHTSQRGRSPLRMVLMAAGLVAIIAGAAIIAVPLLGVFARGSADQSALSSWQRGAANNLAGAPSNPTADPKTVPCGSGSAADYALVTFGAPAAEHYAGVAADGTWDALNNRSMVHYAGTPGPGQQGNSIIAFHREPDYEHIDQLAVGDSISVQDRSCKTYVYRVTNVWTLSPNDVSQLAPTTGHDLTLVTCTPFWVDSLRIVWRATLLSPTV